MKTQTKESDMTGEEVFYKYGNEHTWAYLEGKKESESYIKELESALRELAKDSMALDFNEHWDSFKIAEELLTREGV